MADVAPRRSRAMIFRGLKAPATRLWIAPRSAANSEAHTRKWPAGKWSALPPRPVTLSCRKMRGKMGSAPPDRWL